jgi:hypothetical protein
MRESSKNRQSRFLGWMIGCVIGVAAPLLAGCPTARDIPPPPQDQPGGGTTDEKRAAAPFCGKVFSDPKADPKTAKHNSCCLGPSAGILKAADVATACGAAPATYLGEARDGDACRLYFQPASGEARDSWVMLSHPVIAAGAPAPVRPDPLLPWRWKKVALRGAIGYEALAARDEPGLLEHQTILWAGRGRRIVGLHTSKQVCNENQAQSLLQRAIDAVP